MNECRRFRLLSTWRGANAGWVLPFLLVLLFAAADVRANDSPPNVDLLLRTAPREVKAGEPAVLHVSIAFDNAVKNGVIVLRASDESNVQLKQRYRILFSTIHAVTKPPTPAGKGSETVPGSPDEKDATSRPDPPGLGVVPVVAFEIFVKQAGSYTITAELYHDGGVVRESIELKVVAR